MEVNNYKLLRQEKEDSGSYNRRLQGFAIANRFSRASNYIYVADQIVKLNLTQQFNRFELPS